MRWRRGTGRHLQAQPPRRRIAGGRAEADRAAAHRLAEGHVHDPSVVLRADARRLARRVLQRPDLSRRRRSRRAWLRVARPTSRRRAGAGGEAASRYLHVPVDCGGGERLPSGVADAYQIAAQRGVLERGIQLGNRHQILAGTSAASRSRRLSAAAHARGARRRRRWRSTKSRRSMSSKLPLLHGDPFDRLLVARPSCTA